ncbi:MAG: ActS/PrrB/RegB family redox-sensitive histidine kinase [Rhizomicrobium sp.]
MADASIPGWGAALGGQNTSASGRVRVHTLINLRWMAVGGQTVALLVIYFGFGYTLPLVRCLVCVACLAGLNIFLALRYQPNERLSARETTVYLAFDVLQLAVLLYLTGGITNPFAIMFIAPVVIGAATLDLSNALLLGALALTAGSLIAVAHEPLPWAADMPIALPPLYLAGLWASLILSLAFTSAYVWRIASEGTRMSAGLAASQLALAREQQLSSMGALAAAAAHELGTPLGTIAVVAHELEMALPAGSPEADDAALLREQAERCRKILMRLANPGEEMVGGNERLPVCALLNDLADAYRDLGIDLTITPAAPNRSQSQPQVWRAPELLHGLGNIIENATDFATTKVTMEAAWNSRELRIVISDDGPGFSPEIFERIGEPYTTSRPGYHVLPENTLAPPAAENGKHEGMGLGFFIAKTLLEKTGGTVRAVNPAEGGARVSVVWPRGAIDGETSPSHLSKD